MADSSAIDNLLAAYSRPVDPEDNVVGTPFERRASEAVPALLDYLYGRGNRANNAAFGKVPGAGGNIEPPLGQWLNRNPGIRDVAKQAFDLSMFLGPGAKTANLPALKQAQTMHASGAPREAIWNETGWFQGPDKKWRFEIDDSQAQLMKSSSELGDSGRSIRIADMYNHPELFKAYPDLAETRFAMTSQYKPGEGAFGKLPDGTDIIFAGYKKGWPGSSDIEAVSVIPHELQHGVQRRERFASGSSPSKFTPEMLKNEAFENYSRQINEIMAQNPDAAEAYRAINRASARLKGRADDAALDEIIALETRLHATPEGKRLAELDWQRGSSQHMPNEKWREMAMDRYKRQAGEAEARAVQKRLDLWPDERPHRAPWLDYDVPEAQQIVRFD